MKDWASLPVRLGLGIIFVAHGLQKAFGVFGGPGIKGFTEMLSGLGFSPATFFAYLVACIELIGGLFLLAGLFPELSATLIFIVMLVATVKVHLVKGFFLMNGGFEYNFLIMCSCVSLMISGPGKFCVKKWCKRSK